MAKKQEGSHLVRVPVPIPMHVRSGMTVEGVPQDRQRPDKPRHRVGTLHTPLAPDPRIVKPEVLFALEEGQFHTPAPTISLEDEFGRDRRIGGDQGFIPPLAQRVAHQQYHNRVGLAPPVPEHIADDLKPQFPGRLGEDDGLEFGGVGRDVLDHGLGGRQPLPLLAGTSLPALTRRLGPAVQGGLPVPRADHLEVLRAALERRGVDVGRIADQPEGPIGIGLGQEPRQHGGGLGPALVSGLALLAGEPPEHRQAVIPIGAERQWDRDPQDDPVETEPQRFVFLGREHGVEEDAAEGDLGAALVAERVIDDDPDHTAGDKRGQDQCGQEDPPVVPLPGGGTEHGVSRIVMPPGGPAGGLPDLADGARAEADDPTGEQGLEGGEDAGVETIAGSWAQISDFPIDFRRSSKTILSAMHPDPEEFMRWISPSMI